MPTLMKKLFAALVLTTIAAAVCASQVRAAVIAPVGLVPGSQYQLIFVTFSTRTATSSDIADYNAFVTSEAGKLYGSRYHRPWTSRGAHVARRCIDRHGRRAG